MRRVIRINIGIDDANYSYLINDKLVSHYFDKNGKYCNSMNWKHFISDPEILNVEHLTEGEMSNENLLFKI